MTHVKSMRGPKFGSIFFAIIKVKSEVKRVMVRKIVGKQVSEIFLKEVRIEKILFLFKDELT